MQSGSMLSILIPCGNNVDARATKEALGELGNGSTAIMLERADEHYPTMVSRDRKSFAY